MKHPLVFALEALWWWVREHFQNPIGHPLSQRYQWHGQWRMRVLKRRIVRSWQSGSVRRWLGRQRWFWVLLAAGASLLFASFLATGWWPFASEVPLTEPAQNPLDWLRGALTNPSDKGSNAGAWSLFTVLSGAGIAFALWYFRDQNALWQIENTRKDTNLKDFQKLAEWASGLHLVEWQNTRTQETSKDGDDKVSGSKTIAVEQFTLPMTHNNNDTLRPPSRAEGAASLQIAAVVQLQAFLRGEFGHHFEKPAFTLLTSIWLALMQKHVDAWQDDFTVALSTPHHSPDGEAKIEAFKQWQANLQKAGLTPLAKAITHALAGENGMAMHKHRELLPSLLLAGMNYRFPGLPRLALDGFDLTGIQWQGADLSGAQLEGSRLNFSHLEAANLSRCHLEGAALRGIRARGVELENAHLNSAVLNGAHLEGAHLNFANLQNAKLVFANLKGSNLFRAQLENASLFGAQLKGAHLNLAYLKGADLTNIELGVSTSFAGATTDEKTRVLIIDKDICPLLTHAMRIKLRDENDLVLPDFRYTEFAAHWDAASESQRHQAMQLAGTQTDYEGDPI